MATGIIVPGGRRVTQPQYAAPIDKGNPLTAGLVKAYIPASGMAVPIGGTTPVVGSAGVGFRATSSSAYYQASPTRILSGLSQWTVVAAFSTTQSVSGNGSALYCERGSGGVNILKLEGLGNSNTYLQMTVRDDAFNLVQFGGSSTVTNDGKFHVAAGVQYATNDRRLFIDGRQEASNTGSVTTAYTEAGVESRIGSDANDSSSFITGPIYFVGLYNVALSPAAIASLSVNPWQAFKAPPRRVWVSLATGGTAYTQSISGSLTPAGALTKRTSKPLSGSSTATAALTKQTGKSLSGSSTPAGALAKLTSKAFAGSLTGTGQLVKQTAKAFAGSITGTGALSTMILFTASVAGSITPTGALSKMTQKALAGASTLTGAITKLTSKGLSASITLSGALNKLTTKAFAGSITVTGALAEAYQVVKSLAGSITPAGALATAYIAFVAGVLKMLSLLGVGQ